MRSTLPGGHLELQCAFQRLHGRATAYPSSINTNIDPPVSVAFFSLKYGHSQSILYVPAFFATIECKYSCMKLLSWLWSLVIPNQESEIAKGMAKGAGEFLNLICKPAAEEYGLLLRDRVRYWRAVNTAKMLTQAQGFMATLPSKVHAAPPGIVNAILNEASWIDDAEVQSFWAGLLASACTEDGKDESNKIFINILKQMTALEVKIFSLACERAEKKVYGSGAIAAGRSWKIEVSELMSLVPVTDFHQLDRELDHMRQLGLLLDSGGIHIDLNPAIVDLTPSGLALQMYARCKGASRDPVSFYALTPEPAKTPEAGTAFKLLT